jgi:hypothetical protein
VDRIDRAIKLLREAQALLDAEMNYRIRVQQAEHDWQIDRIEDAQDRNKTNIEDLQGLPPTQD